MQHVVKYDVYLDTLPVRLCRSCLRGSGDLRNKNMPLPPCFGVCLLRILPPCFGVCLLRILTFLMISGNPKPFSAVSRLPVPLQLIQKKNAAGRLEYVSCGFGVFEYVGVCILWSMYLVRIRLPAYTAISWAALLKICFLA